MYRSITVSRKVNFKKVNYFVLLFKILYTRYIKDHKSKEVNFNTKYFGTFTTKKTINKLSQTT